MKILPTVIKFNTFSANMPKYFVKSVLHHKETAAIQGVSILCTRDPLHLNILIK